MCIGGWPNASAIWGDFADARANYLKVTEYDPDSRHAKDARKALKDPEIANAKPESAGQAAGQPAEQSQP